MKITRGDYPGASKFARFEKPVHEMTIDEARGLLECILHRASPGEPNADILFAELKIAEATAATQ